MPQTVYEKLESLYCKVIMNRELVESLYCKAIMDRIYLGALNQQYSTSLYKYLRILQYLPVRDPLGLTVCFQSPKVAFECKPFRLPVLNNIHGQFGNKTL